MVRESRVPDCANEITPREIFAEEHKDGDSGGCDFTTEGILKGHAEISKRPEIKQMEKLLLKPIPDYDEVHGG